MSNALQIAVKLAKEAHGRQVDKGGQPYIQHCLRVMNSLQTPNAKIVGVLHDILEDTDVTTTDLLSAGLSMSLVRKVVLLTRCIDPRLTIPWEYDEYIICVGRDPITRMVKLADLNDNMRLGRLSAVAPKDIERMKKYHRAWIKLGGSPELERDFFLSLSYNTARHEEH